MLNTTGDLSKSHLFNVQDGTIVLAGLAAGDGELERQKDDIVDNKYKIAALLGQGGMGAVYRAQHLMLDKDVALKTFRTTQLTEEACVRFQREARAIARLNHKHVVRVFDFGLFADGVPYYTMEFLLGISLGDRLKKHGPLPIEQTFELFIQICQGLSEAHAKGIIHRDLKPGNLFIESILVPKGKIDIMKIVDFGIASLATQGQAEQQATTNGTIFGSPLYMSPEHSMGQAVTERSDIYSLGCSLYEALTGKPPFRGDHALETVLMHHSATPPTLEEASGGKTFSTDLENLLAKMLEKSAKDRPASVAEVEAEIARIASGANTKDSRESAAGAKSLPPRLESLERQFAGQAGIPAQPAMAGGHRVTSAPAASPETGDNAPPSGSATAETLLEGTEEGSAATSKARVMLVAVTALILVGSLIAYSRNTHTKSAGPANTSHQPTDKQKNGRGKVNSSAADPADAEASRFLNASRLRRTVENGPHGSKLVVYYFPLKIDYGVFVNPINFSKKPAWQRVVWDDSLKPIFEPSETFLILPNALETFGPDDLSGLRLHWCEREQKNARLVKQIAKLTGLLELDLSESDIGDADISPLDHLTHLKFLALSETHVTGARLGKIPQLKELVLLKFCQCRGAGDLLTKLQGSKVIERLDLSYDYLTQEDFKKIATLPKLGQLRLDGCDLDDKEMEILSTMKSLRIIYCRTNKLTASSMPAIRRMKSNGLKYLDATGGKLPPGAMQEIRRLFPNSETSPDEYANLHTLPTSAFKDLKELKY